MSIEKYILPKFTACKLADSYIEIEFCDKRKLNEDTKQQQLECSELTFPFARSNVCLVPLKESSMLFDHEVCEQQLESANSKTALKSIMEISLDIQQFTGTLADFQPGDTIGILPQNPECEIEQLLASLHLEQKADEIITLKLKKDAAKKHKLPGYVPLTTTPRLLLRDCLNLRSVLKKQFLRGLAECCSNAEEANFLNYLSSKEGSALYAEVVLEKSLTLQQLLRLCASCKPHLALLIEHLPRLLPRPYSIVNSNLSSTQEIKIIFSILPEKIAAGLTTSMLQHNATLHKQQQIPITIPIYLRSTNSFRYTIENYAENQILIAIGTGVAPYLGFLQHKSQLKSKSSDIAAGETWLYVGATHHATIPYRSELMAYHDKAILNQYTECISRESLQQQQYHYIQESLFANAKSFVEFLMLPNTTLYLCADGAHISKSVEAAIQQCLSQQLQLDEMQSAALVKNFKTTSKYREDVWL